MSEMFYADIIQNKPIAEDTFDLRIQAPAQAMTTAPGQFLSVFTGNPAMLLPRPLSICEIDADNNTFRIIYRIAGDGTKEIANTRAGGKLRVLGPLGNGFYIDTKYNNYAIVGGGIGAPPLLELAKRIRKEIPNSKIAVYLGFRSKSQLILEDDFKKYADEVMICTDNGTYGIKGNAIAAMPPNADFDMVYGCGPKVMLKFLAQYAEQRNMPCFVSMEEHMACSIGACLACVVKVHPRDLRRVCCDGPVFNAKEVVWE